MEYTTPQHGTASSPLRAGMVRLLCALFAALWGYAVRAWDYVRYGGLRRFLLGAPLLLPLLAVLGSLMALYGNTLWFSAVAALLVPCAAYRLWRIGMCAVLCAAVAYLHGLDLEQQGRLLRDAAEQQGCLAVQGRVVRDLERGCVLETPAGPSVVLRGERGGMPFSLGDDVEARGIPVEQAPPPVPGMFDAAAWQRGQGIALSLDYTEGRATGHALSLVDLRRAGLDIRRMLEKRLMPPGTEADPRRQVLCAMVLGDKAAAAEDTMEGFRRGGCLHVFAVSGLHVALVFGIFWKLLLFCRLRPAVARPVVLLLVGAYVVCTGCALPAFRALLMLAVVLFGYMLRRRVGMANTWSFAALLVLLLEPFRIHDAGFLLSFTVYAGICAGVFLCRHDRPLYAPDDYLPKRLWSPVQRFLSNRESDLRACAVVSVSAWLVSLPVILCCFHAVTPWSAVANMAVAALLLPLMFCGIMTLLLGWVPLLGGALDFCALKCSGWLLAVVGAFGSLPGAYLPVHTPMPADSAAVYTQRYGGSVCVLGNPGLLVNCGNERTASFQVRPWLFHSGFSPAALLVTGKRASLGGGAEYMCRQLPGLRVLRHDSLPQGGLRLITPGGAYTVYPAAPGARDAAPVVIWQQGGRRVLYVGDAPADTLLSLPPEELHADTVILGKHPLQPVQDPALLRATGARRIIILPGAELPLVPEDFPPRVQIIRLHDDEVCAV